jgi:hypothetical protein
VAEEFKKQLTDGGVVALVGTTDGKAAVTVAVTADLVGKFSAADLAKAAVIAMGGQGAGGKARLRPRRRPRRDQGPGRPGRDQGRLGGLDRSPSLLREGFSYKFNRPRRFASPNDTPVAWFRPRHGRRG